MTDRGPKMHIDWRGFFSGALVIARQIRTAGYQPDSILAVARGGLPLATVLAHEFHVKQNFHVINLTRSALVDFGGNRTIQFYGDLPSVTGKRLLIVDDINCEGWTFTWIKEKLKIVEDGVQNKYCALVNRTSSDFKGVEFAAWTLGDRRWVNFPWEQEEDGHHWEHPDERAPLLKPQGLTEIK